MKIKPEEIKIPPDNIFVNDRLRRDVPIKNLTAIFKNMTDPFVISINASYGQGKTTFINLWKAYLESQKIHSITFNAWENDYTDNPLACLVSEIKSTMDEKRKSVSPNDGQLIQTYYEELVKISGKVVKAVLPVVVKIATSGILRMDDFKEEAIADFLEKSTETVIKEYSENKNLFGEFKTTLKQNIQSFSEGNPFFIFIDDLDRCRPNFAIEVLETIKHLFNIEGVIFVLTLDEKQIKSCISHVYGAGMEPCCGYLRRFIDLSYTLPDADVADYCGEMFQRFDLFNYFRERETGRNMKESEKFKSIEADVIALVRYFKLTLRDVEKIFTHFAIILRSLPQDQCIFPNVFLLLLVLKLTDPDMYKRIVTRQVKTNDLLKYFSEKLNISEVSVLEDKSYILRQFLLWMNLALEEHVYDSKWNDFYNELVKHYSSNKEVLSNIERMREYSKTLIFDGSFNNLLILMKERIELLGNIKV